MRLNRGHFLCSGGLKFPEAMHGFSWQNDLAMSLLLHEEHVGARRLSEQLLNEHRGTFRDRERINSNRVIAIRLTWADSALVLFLNWLDGLDNRTHSTLHSRQKENAELLWQDIAQSDKLGQPLTQSLRSLSLAIRYFNSWMAAAQISLVEDRHDLEPKELDGPATFISSVGAAALKTDCDKRAEELRHAITSVLHAGNTHCHVHWVSSDGDGGNYLEIKNAVLLDAERFEYHDQGSKSAPDKDYRFPVAPARTNDARLRVAKSICAQAALWRVSLLVDYATCKRYWKHIRIRRDDLLEPASEIAVPVLSGSGQVNGVVSVEIPKSQTVDQLREYLRRIELATQLYRKLRTIFELDEQRASGPVSGNAAGMVSPAHKAQRFIKDLVNIEKQSRIASFQHVAKMYCSWSRNLLNADLAYLVVYDARSDLFHPIGTTISEDVAIQFLSNEQECQLGHSCLTEREQNMDGSIAGSV